LKIEGNKYLPTLEVASIRKIDPQGDLSSKTPTTPRPRVIPPLEESKPERDGFLEKGALLDIYA
jgi:hypothetical protein